MTIVCVMVYLVNIRSKTNDTRRKMLTLEQIKERLTESNLMAVSKAAGVHSNALYRLMNGGVKPSYETVKRLSDYLEGKE